LKEVFIVSEAGLAEEKSAAEALPVNLAFENTVIGVACAQGEKCERCWNYGTLTGTDKSYPGICPRCVKELKEQEGADR